VAEAAYGFPLFSGRFVGTTGERKTTERRWGDDDSHRIMGNAAPKSSADKWTARRVGTNAHQDTRTDGRSQ